MEKDNWRTYNGDQAQQVLSGLQVLLDRGALDEKEQDTARSIQRKLSYRGLGREQTMITFNKKEDELLQQVEAALWR